MGSDDIDDIPATIGPYEIIRILGEGGMGTVYLAQQHEPLERRVALKVIKLGMDSREVLRRFEFERRALARMNHDHVARVHEAGTTERGQPYFVMEYVDGLPLNEYCDQHALSTRERIRLFVQVCTGVHHAHVKGILHRDLKPSNVIVARQGEEAVPKIIDFGLARATDQQGFEATRMTELGQILGTPEYMSPEQAELGSDDVDARTDIYSLGVLLYELMVGAVPLSRAELLSDGILEGLRKIREQESPRPSTRLSQLGAIAEQVAARRNETATSLRRALRGDLDWIVLKALAKERDRRYQSAEAFAADLVRHLQHEPVAARPPSRGYQLAKYVRRHRVPVAAAVAVVLALAGGIVSYAIENRRAIRNGEAAIAARGVAEARLQLAMDAIDSYFTGVTEDVLLREEELADLRAKLLQTPLGFYRELRASLEEGEASRADRGRLAHSLSNLASLNESVGRPAEARALYDDARVVLEELAAEEPNDPAHREALVDLLARCGRNSMMLGQVDDARAAFRDLVQAADEGVERGLVDASWRAAGMEELAVVEASVGHYPEAEELLTDAIEFRTSRIEADPSQRGLLADAYYSLAEVHRFSSEGARAEASYRAALELREELLDEHPESIELADQVAYARQGLATMLTTTLRYDEATEELRSAIELRERLVAALPAVNRHWSSLAGLRHDLASALTYAGQHQRALEEYGKAIEVFERLVDKLPDVPRYRLLLARSGQNRGELLARMNRHEEGIESLGVALSAYQSLLESSPDTIEFRRDMATTANTLATLLQGLGRLDEARDAYESTVASLAALLAETPDSEMFRGRLCATEYNVAQLAERSGDYDRALEMYQRALATARPPGGGPPTERLAVVISIRASRGRAEVLSRLDRFDEALPAWDAALATVREDSERVAMQAFRLVTLARSGEGERATNELEELIANAADFPPDLYLQAAMVHAQAFAHTPDAESSAAAIEYLFQALDEGVFDNPHRVLSLRTDPFLEPLRDLPDFASLLGEVE